MSKAVIRNGRIVYDDEAAKIRPNDTVARANRESMRTKYRKDMLQKNQVEYYKAYPEQAKELPDETRRLLS